MSGFDHLSIMLAECVALLSPAPGKVMADLTAGGGGHSAALRAALTPGGRLLCLDRDDLAIEHLKRRFAEDDVVTVCKAAFSELPERLEVLGFGLLDGVLADLGVSSPQLDTAERGFSLREDGPLDMRMDQSAERTALDLIAELSEQELADVLYKYGEERRSRAIAASIKRAYAAGQLRTTSDLRRAVVRVLGPKRGRIDPATRTFQGIRIAVNDELGELRSLLSYLPDVLADDGVAAIISFHSLEDRMVKHAFRDDPRLSPLTKRPQMASEQEQQDNPRARSAKLRAARRLPRTQEEQA